MVHLDQGKYAVFVWSAYAASGIGLGAVVLQTLLSARRWRRLSEETDKRGSSR